MTKRYVIRNRGGNNRHITKSGVDLVRQMAAGGHSLATMAQALKINRVTLHHIMERQPEVRDAIEEGYSNMEFALVDRMMQTAMSDDNRNSNFASVYLLNNRCGYSNYKTPKHLTIINQDNRKQVLVAPEQSIKDYVNRWTVQDGEDIAIPAERS